MENAAQALYMAAGVLIGLMILSLGVYLFADFGQTSKELHEQIDFNQITEFNAQFTKFEGIDATIHDVISLANLAEQNNKNYDDDPTPNNTNYKVDVKINNTSLVSGKSIDERLADIEKEVKDQNQDDGSDVYTYTAYNVEEIKYNENGRVYEIKFRSTTKTR